MANRLTNKTVALPASGRGKSARLPLNLAPMGATLVVAPLLVEGGANRGDHKGRPHQTSRPVAIRQ